MKNEEIADRINDLKELIEAKMAPLATREDVINAIQKHHETCNQSSPWSKVDIAKLTTKIVVAIGGLTGAVYGLIQILN